MSLFTRSMSLFTVLGAGGTIGCALAMRLRDQGHDVQRIGRAELPAFLNGRDPAGHVINCIGLTGDFRQRPLDTAEAHVGIPARCLARGNWTSFLYLSSTRLYAEADATHEDSPITLRPDDPYNATKLAGESLCLSDPRPTARVVRLSNVYSAYPAPGSFLGQVLAEGRATGRVRFRQAAESAKDYIALDDVVALLPTIATSGRHRLYNLATGRNVPHAMVSAVLRESAGWLTDFAPDAPIVRFPPIDTTRLGSEFALALSVFSEAFGRIASRQEAPC